MSQRRKASATREEAAEQAMRDQEVLRANSELAKYFKGQRTEREARAALKIIKAFVRDRERCDGKTRRPLPDATAAKPVPEIVNPTATVKRGARRRRKPRRETQRRSSKRVRSTAESLAKPALAGSSESNEQTAE